MRDQLCVVVYAPPYRDNRREEKVLSRLRTGCCRFIFQHYFDPMLSREYCNYCRVPMTISHLLINCVNFTYSRSRITNFMIEFKFNLVTIKPLHGKFQLMPQVTPWLVGSTVLVPMCNWTLWELCAER